MHATYPSSLFITLHSQSQNVNSTQHLPFFHWWTNPTTTDIPLILAILTVYLCLLKKKLNGGATSPPPPPPPPRVRRYQKYWTLQSVMSKARSWRWRWLKPLRLREFRRLCSSIFFLVSSVCNVRGLAVLPICVWLCNGCPIYIYIYIYMVFELQNKLMKKLLFKKKWFIYF